MVLETIEKPKININGLSFPETRALPPFDVSKEVIAKDWDRLKEYMEEDYHEFQHPPEGIEQVELHANFLEIGAGMKIIKPKEFTSPTLDNYTRQVFEALIIDEVTVKHQSSDDLNFTGWRTLVLYPELKAKFDEPFKELAKVAFADTSRLTWGALLAASIMFPEKAPEYAEAAKGHFLASKSFFEELTQDLEEFYEGEESVDKKNLLDGLEVVLEAVAIYKILCQPPKDEILVDQYFWPGLSNVLNFLRTEMHNDDSTFGSVGAACRFSTLVAFGAIIAADSVRINDKGELEVSNRKSLEEVNPMPEERSF